MHFKLLFLTVACCAFFIQPAHSGNIKSAAINTVSDIVSIGSRVAKAKGAAVVKAVADIASIVATGAGLKVRAIGNAASSMKGAVADGMIAVGDSFAKAGATITAGKMGGSTSSGSTRVFVQTPVVEEVVEEVKVKTPAVVEEEVIVPCEQEVVEVPVESYPVRSVQMKVREPVTIVETAPRSFVGEKATGVWDLLKNAAEMRANGVGQIFTPNVRSPFVYEIVETPRLFQGPLVETFQINKK